MFKYLLLILPMLFSTDAISALNKWVDAEGRVHYSDVAPPPDASARILRTAPSASDSKSEGGTTTASAPAAPKSLAEREIELKKAQKAKKEAADKAAKAQADEAAKKTYCDSLRQNLRVFQEGIRMVEIDAEGNRSYLEDDQRQQRIAKAQQEISANCK